MNDPKKELIEAINGAQNVLVTVRKNPSIDQLAAAIGTTLVINKLGKHGTAVFSGETPSTIDFLKPESTLETTTDSLRDFIISLDKSKADKLRYKVEDQHVKIFITPYRTTIGQPDLEFSQGDFNVDVVLALGVHERSELDQAITAHGRILHDAKIISVNLDHAGELGGINIVEKSSSLSEVMSHVSTELKDGLFDAQIATAFLTGIVSETERFSNEKTLPETMTISAKLMVAGANQQLVATQLEIKPEPEVPAKTPEAEAEPEPVKDTEPDEPVDSVKHDDGSLEIVHHNEPPKDEAPQANPYEIAVDEHGNLKDLGDDSIDSLPAIQPLDAQQEEPIVANNPKLPAEEPDEEPEVAPEASNDDGDTVGEDESQENVVSEDELESEAEPLLPPKTEPPQIRSRGRMILEPPAAHGTLTANAKPESIEDSVDPLSPATSEERGPMLSHDKPGGSKQQSELVGDNNSSQSAEADANELKSAVDAALESAADLPALEPIAALNANHVDLDLSHEDSGSSEQQLADSQAGGANEDYLDITKVDTNTGLSNDDAAGQDVETPQQPQELKLPPIVDDSTSATDAPSAASPPPVPPPMMPPVAGGLDDALALPPVQR